MRLAALHLRNALWQTYGSRHSWALILVASVCMLLLELFGRVPTLSLPLGLAYVTLWTLFPMLVWGVRADSVWHPDAHMALPLGLRTRRALEFVALLSALLVVGSVGQWLVTGAEEEPVEWVRGVVLASPLVFLGVVSHLTNRWAAWISLGLALGLAVGVREELLVGWPAALGWAGGTCLGVWGATPWLRRPRPPSAGGRAVGTQRGRAGLWSDAVRGPCQQLPRLLLIMVGISVFMASIYVWEARPTFADGKPVVLWMVVLAGSMALAGVVFLPLGLPTRTHSPSRPLGDMDGSFGEAWARLPVDRRALTWAVYLPGVVSLWGAIGLGWVAALWLDLGEEGEEVRALVPAMFALTPAVPALITGGACGRRRTRWVTGLALALVLGSALVAAFSFRPWLGWVFAGVTALTGVVLPIVCARDRGLR